MKTIIISCLFGVALFAQPSGVMRIEPNQNPTVCGVTSVDISGSFIPQKAGTYSENPANKWSSINNLKSKFRILNHNPKLTIKRQNESAAFWLVKLNPEESYRYIYISIPGHGSDGSSPSEGGSLVQTSWKLLPDNTIEIEPISPLLYGEYAIWTARGVAPPLRNSYKSKQEYKDAVYQYVGGVFWAFGVDDPD